jgi:hypothetical protein
MTAVRKIVDSSALVNLFDLPPALMNRKVEVVLFPVEETAEKISVPSQEGFPRLTMAQIEEWAKAPEIQVLVGALKGANLPADININDIRHERLEKYKV